MNIIRKFAWLIFVFFVSVCVHRFAVQLVNWYRKQMIVDAFIISAADDAAHTKPP